MPSNDIEQSVDHALVYAEKAANRRATSSGNILAIALFIIVTGWHGRVFDFATSQYPENLLVVVSISSILFAWVVMIPFLKCGRKGLLGSLVALSIFIIPFLVCDR